MSVTNKETTVMEEETNKDFPFLTSSSTYPITLKVNNHFLYDFYFVFLNSMIEF